MSKSSSEKKPGADREAPSEDAILRRLLATPPKPHAPLKKRKAAKHKPKGKEPG